MGLNLINASNKSGEAIRASVTAIRSAGSTTITVDAMTNWPTNFIATSGTLLADGTLSAATVFAGHKSGSAIVIDTLAPGYTDVGNTVGQVVVIKPTTYWADNFADFLAINFADNGTFTATGATNIVTALTGKSVRLNPRISAVANTAAFAPDIATYNQYEISAQAQALVFYNPVTGGVDGDIFILLFKDDGTSRAITWDTMYVNVSGVDLLTTTTAGKWHAVGVRYNAAAVKWQIVSISTEA
jgi:hypothetical protein